MFWQCLDSINGSYGDVMNITIINADTIHKKRIPQITAYINGLLSGEIFIETNKKEIDIRQKGLVVANIFIEKNGDNYLISLKEEERNYAV